MKQNERFEDILSECLDRILNGESVEQCLLSYPDLAKELEPLLNTARAARVASTIQPRTEFKARARYEFQAALQDMKVGKERRRPLFNWQWQWQSGWAIALIAVIVVILAGVGTIAAADHSMPDSPLYSVKLASEKVQMALTFSDIGKAERNAKFADRRAEEIVYMASRGSAHEVRIVAGRLNSNLENITNLTGSISSQPAGSNTNRQAAESAPSSQNNQQPAFGVASSSDTAGPGPIPPAAAPAPAANVPAAVPAAPVPAPSIKATQAPPSTSRVASVDITTKAPPAPQNVETNRNLQNTGSAARSRTAEQEKLKQIVVSNYNTLQNKLEEALNIAPPDVRQAVRQAIALSQAEYEKALENIEMAENAN